MNTPWHVTRALLIQDGAMSEQNTTRTPKPRHCRHCGRAVIAAITDLGFEVAVEPAATTIRGELETVLNGGATYAVLEHGEMVWRDQHRIKWADANREKTHPQHHCEKPPPETNPIFEEARARRDITGPPTF